MVARGAMQVLLDAQEVARGLRRIALEICERHSELSHLLLVGVRRGGVPVAVEIARAIQELEGVEVAMGTVDVTLYRDDAATALPNPRIGPSDIPGPVTGERVILIDDVLHTRRTARAALEAILDYGRPANIELVVVVDRTGRELPIQPDYCVRRLESVPPDHRVDVCADVEGRLQAVLLPRGAPSLPPPQPPAPVRSGDGK